MIDLIELAGVALDLDDVEYTVSVQHGRSDVTTAPSASNCQIIIRGAVGVNAEIADSLVIRAYNEPRFSGEVSDIRITHLSTDPPTAITTITGIGNLSKVSFVEVGASGFPKESVFDRVESVLSATGLDYLNGADTVLELEANNSPTITDALSYLAQVAEWTGATYFDDPYGRVVFESYGNRGITTFAGIWATQPDGWASAGGTWADIPTDMATIDLPYSKVIWSPAWSKTRTTIINQVTVLSYGDAHEETQSDSASIAAYGLKEYRLQTEIKSATDVATRAGRIITAQANPLWSLGEISILVDQLEPADQAKVLVLISGMAVSLRNLPQPAPQDNFLGIVEGWGETYSDGQHILTLSISDPRYSFETVTWGEVDPALEWGDVPVGLQWFEIITGSDLAA